MNNENTARKHAVFDIPVLGPLLAECIALVFILGIFGGIGQIIDPDSKSCIPYVLLIVGSLLYLLIHKFWFRPEFKGCLNINRGSTRIFKIIIIAFAAQTVLDLANLFFTGAQVPNLISVIMALSAGFAEEVPFRGIPVSIAMRNCKNKTQIVVISVITSVVFGAIHAFNRLLGADYFGTILQVISASCAGLFFCAVYITTGNLLIPIFFHFVHDMLAFCASNVNMSGVISSISTADYVSSGILAVVQLICAILLLKTDTDEILALWNGLWSKEQVPCTKKDDIA